MPPAPTELGEIGVTLKFIFLGRGVQQKHLSPREQDQLPISQSLSSSDHRQSYRVSFPL